MWRLQPFCFQLQTTPLSSEGWHRKSAAAVTLCSHVFHECIESPDCEQIKPLIAARTFKFQSPKFRLAARTQLPDKQVVSCHPLSGECHLAWNCDVPEPTTIKLFNYLRNFWLAWQQNIDVSTISSFNNQEDGSEHYRGNWFGGERWECHRWGKSLKGSVVQNRWIYKWPNSSYYLAVQNWSTCPNVVVYDNDSKGDSDLAYVWQNLKPLAVDFHIMEVWTKDTCKIIFISVWKLV